MPSPEFLDQSGNSGPHQCGDCQSPLIESVDYMDLHNEEVFVVCYCNECTGNTGITMTYEEFDIFENKLADAEDTLDRAAGRLAQKDFVLLVPNELS